MVSEVLRTTLLLSLIGAFTWVATGAAYDQEPSFVFNNTALCIHRSAPGEK